ncbi:MAG: DUF4238 domain-containing protein [Chloroflexota bacterium]|nr:DUF4238 domain-containing protein [Chloroflexota bacterium]
MAKKHHFVPKFYLRLFTDNPNLIHVYNLKQQRAIENAALRDQCYKPHLHGLTDEFENEIASVEGALAPYLQSVVGTSTLPEKESDGHIALLMFVAFQMNRTTRSINIMSSGFDKMVQTVQEHADSKGYEVEGLDTLLGGREDPVRTSISLTWETLQIIRDLELLLLRTSPSQPFVTSDNPVFKYNQYLEGVRGFGITGNALSGLQIFVPLSGSNLLMLYDSGVYRLEIPSNKGVISNLNDRDRMKLNQMQVHSAEENLYFGDWSKVRYVAGIAQGSIAHKIWDPVKAHELVSRTVEDRSFIHQYNELPNLKLNLSFLGLRKQAQQLTLEERLSAQHRFRIDPSILFPEPALPPGVQLRTARFAPRVGPRTNK